MSGLCDQITREREARRKRDHEIVAAREAGQSYAAIGRAFQMSGDNVKDRIERFHRNKRMHESIDPFVKLTPRTLRLLHGEGMTTVEKVVEVYRRNELFSYSQFRKKEFEGDRKMVSCKTRQESDSAIYNKRSLIFYCIEG